MISSPPALPVGLGVGSFEHARRARNVVMMCDATLRKLGVCPPEDSLSGRVVTPPIRVATRFERAHTPVPGQ